MCEIAPERIWGAEVRIPLGAPLRNKTGHADSRRLPAFRGDEGAKQRAFVAHDVHFAIVHFYARGERPEMVPAGSGLLQDRRVGDRAELYNPTAQPEEPAPQASRSMRGDESSDFVFGQPPTRAQRARLSTRGVESPRRPGPATCGTAGEYFRQPDVTLSKLSALAPMT